MLIAGNWIEKSTPVFYWAYIGTCGKSFILDEAESTDNGTRIIGDNPAKPHAYDNYFMIN